MDLSMLKTVYAHEGPFATVYLEARPPAEDSAEELRLRWRALRERVESDVDSETLSELDGAVDAQRPGATQADGRVIVACDGKVVLDAPWDAALGTGDTVHCGQLPELGPFVRESARTVRELVVLADQQSAEVRQVVLAEEHEPREADAEEVRGSAGNAVHQPRGGAFSHNQIRRHAEENLARNAEEIAAQISLRANEFHPDVLVLAGAVEARTAVREQLPDRLGALLVETDRGGKGAGASEESLTDELLRIAAETSTEYAKHRRERFDTGLEHGLAVQGAELVAEAATQGAVEQLLLVRDQPAVHEAELLKGCAQTAAAVGLLPEGPQPQDGVAALLRFPLP